MPSSETSGPIPGLIQTVVRSMPSTARFQKSRDEDGWYVLVDPAGRYRVNQNGGATSNRGEGPIAAVMIVTILACGIWAATNGSNWFWVILLFVLGAAGGTLAGGVICLPLAGIGHALQKADDRARNRTVLLRVQRSVSQAWRLCEIATHIAKVDAWRDRTVDPNRRVCVHCLVRS